MKSKIYHIRLFILGLFVFFQPAIKNTFAESIYDGVSTEYSDTIPDSLIVQLDEVVVSAFNRSQALIEIPGSLTYLGNLIIEREKPTYNLFPVLNYAPGIFAHSGATNTSRVTIRGIGARVPYATGKIRAYFNNIPLTNTSGVTFIQDIDPAVIESMEIIKGPATSVYGAGLGGTITMTARRPAGRQTAIRNTTQAGSFGMFRNSVAADLALDNFATSIVYSHTQSEGYRENNEFRRDAITSVSQFEGLGNTSFTTLFAFSDLKSHIPSSIDSITFANDPQSAATNWLKTRGYEDARRLLGGITASRNFLPGFSADLSVFTIWHDEKEMRPFDVFYEERFTLGSRFKANRGWEINSVNMEFIAGGEVFVENYLYSNHENIDGEGIQGAQFSDNKEWVSTYNVFVQSDANYNRLNLSAGVNLNFTQRDYTDLFNEGAQNLSGTYDYGFIISPRISAGYLYYKRNSVFLTLSHGFSPPSLAETLTPEGFINPDIRPEKSWNLELGFRGNLSGNRLFYDVSLYRMQVQDLLVAERVAEDDWVGRNAGESLHRGIEAELHWVVKQNFFAKGFEISEFSIRTNYTLNHFYFTDFVDRENDYSGNQIPGVPENIFFSGVYAELGFGIYAMGGLRYVGSMTMNDANTRFTDPYYLMDITLGYKKEFDFLRTLDVFFRVNNLFNTEYASMILVNAPSFGNTLPRYYYPGLPVHFTLGLRAGI
ncbi:MAG: TonB-dependent receptor [Bacteroidetes bacterium]|nr:MAG: TonB-dependent receptor [Bacteroidota bacterium]